MAIYWEKYARPRATRALAEAGLLPTSVSPHKGLAHLFSAKYEATPLQTYAERVDLPDGPLLFIIEDMTGAGKTEAAVILAHRLMLSGKAQGLYIALPTMATANAMFMRLASSYRRLFDETRAPMGAVSFLPISSICRLPPLDMSATRATQTISPKSKRAPFVPIGLHARTNRLF